ncbi:MAG: glycosyltransferase [Hespellia sp.]|nr:glycosyltransferase [Hespellia sp.]
MEKTRTEHSARNTVVAVISRMMAILMGFVVRVVFAHRMSEAYVGVCGLFSNIITVLALPELDIVTAIPYALYDPIARGDEKKQKSLMKLYQKFYHAMSGAILIFGVVCIPFLRFMTGDQKVEHLTLIYLLFLTNSALSYLWTYKRTLIDAHQLISVGVWYQTVFLVIQDVVQIVVLWATQDFILFVLVSLCCTLARNIAISQKADRLYPLLRENDVEPIPEEESREIFRNIRAMMLHKTGNVLVNNTDNLLLSALIGLSSVGCYFNYYLVIGSVRQVLNQVLQGITASVGDLGVSADKGRMREVLEDALFVGQWVFGFAAICIYELINPFMEVGFGRQYVFPMSVVLVLCLKFYVAGMRQAVLVFRDALGLFWLDRYKVIVETILNLGISVVLALRLGTLGVFLGTLFSMLLTSVWIEPFVLYRHLGLSLKNYFARYLIYAVVAGVTATGIHRICLGKGFFGKLFICLFGVNLLWMICYGKTREFGELCRRGRQILFRGRKRDENQKAPDKVPFLTDARKPLISVIVPVYQSARYLETCIQSVLGQTYSNFELILVDDGSKDNSREICESLSTQESRIRLLAQKHKGVSAARNAGIRAAKGEYLFFLDSDDAIHPELLEQLCKLAEKSQATISVCEYRRVLSGEFDKRKKKLDIRKYRRNGGSWRRRTAYLNNQEALRSFVFEEGFVLWAAVWGRLIRRSEADGLWFDEALSNEEDTKYMYQLLEKGANAAILQYRGYYYRERNNSVSRQKCLKAFKSIYVCDCYIRDREMEYNREAHAVQRERDLVSKIAWWYVAGHRTGDETLRSYVLELEESERASELWGKLGLSIKLQHLLAFQCYPVYEICRILRETWLRIRGL